MKVTQNTCHAQSLSHQLQDHSLRPASKNKCSTPHTHTDKQQQQHMALLQSINTQTKQAATAAFIQQTVRPCCSTCSGSPPSDITTHAHSTTVAGQKNQQQKQTPCPCMMYPARHTAGTLQRTLLMGRPPSQTSPSLRLVGPSGLCCGCNLHGCAGCCWLCHSCVSNGRVGLRRVLLSCRSNHTATGQQQVCQGYTYCAFNRSFNGQSSP